MLIRSTNCCNNLTNNTTFNRRNFWFAQRINSKEHILPAMKISQKYRLKKVKKVASIRNYQTAFLSLNFIIFHKTF